jgi:hypothetical protein
MRKIIIELQIEGIDEEDYENVCDELTVEDLLIDCKCSYVLFSGTQAKQE